MSQDLPYAIHWFRRDLRVSDNPALNWARRDLNGRVLGLFCFDSKFLSRPDFSVNRFGFFLSTLKALQTELRELGGDLLVMDVGPAQAFAKLFQTLSDKKIRLPRLVSFNRDYEPFARERDSAIRKLLSEDFGITVHTARDHLIIEPEELSKPDGGVYKIFTPFSRRWNELFRQNDFQRRLDSPFKPGRFSLTWDGLFAGSCPLIDSFQEYFERNQKQITVKLPQAGSVIALSRLKQFKIDRLEQYNEQRDLPSVRGTSGLSIFLKNGSLTSAQIFSELNVDRPDFGLKDGKNTYLKEVVWREFYYHILYHFPLVEHEAFIEKFRNIQWENRIEFFEAWKLGQTGFPIVDAGMRQLNQTGWMHNRVRMIVASFLSKDLLIDWRWGEKYFMEKLLDGDLAPNNGGWQWAASTGCDPQPYFRIFNPWTQSKKFDPFGKYIRKYVPELASLTDKQIHEPHRSGQRLDYPRPIVDHAQRRQLALEKYLVPTF